MTISPLGIRWVGVNSSSDDHRGTAVWSRTRGHLQEDGGGTGVHGHACAMGPKQNMLIEGNSFCSSCAGALVGTDHGHPVPENVLAGTTCTHPGHAAHHYTSDMGSRTDAEGDRPPGPNPAGFSQAGIAAADGVVAVDIPGGARPSQFCTGLRVVCGARFHGGAVQAATAPAKGQTASTVWRHGCHHTPSPRTNTYGKLRQ